MAKKFAALSLLALTGMAQAAVIPAGLQAGITTTQVANWGWSECARTGSDTYNVTIASIVSSCNKGYVGMAVWDKAANTFAIAGFGERAVVTTPIYDDYNGDDFATTQNWSNGLNWYLTSDQGSGSWGFTTSHQTALYSADVNLENGLNNFLGAGETETELAAGLSFHVGYGFLNGGWAFNPDGNSQTYLYSDNYERVFFTADANAATVPLPPTIALMGLGLAGLVATRRRRAGKAAA